MDYKDLLNKQNEVIEKLNKALNMADRHINFYLFIIVILTIGIVIMAIFLQNIK